MTSRQSTTDDYPSDLAWVLADAMNLWDESLALGEEAADLDPILAECIENDWTMSEFLALYLRRRPVEERMAWMGMTERAPFAKSGHGSGCGFRAGYPCDCTASGGRFWREERQ